MSEFPPVPLTLEGSSLLHQFFRFDWKTWRACADGERSKIAAEAIAALKAMERDGEDHNGEGPNGEGKVQTALYSQLGHKGDLILIHFRESMEALNRVELALAQTRFYDFLELKHSYVSVVELGLYESTRKTYEAAAAKGLAPHTAEWDADVAEAMERGAEAMKARLFPAVPEAKFMSFYPMDRARTDARNWYTVPFAERQRMMHEHGMIGRRYGDRVKQVISGSIGMDDWEWGVTLFAEDPVVFKKLIYEMRFDEVSAVYALFGQFFLGIRLPLERLGGWLEGKV